VVKMDVSRKIPKEDINLLNELQVGLRRRDINLSQKDLIDRAIKFSLKDNRQDFIKTLKFDKLKKHKDEKKMWDEWLNNGVRIKGDILEEHDTIL